MPGDEIIPQPLLSMTHAVTIHRPPEDVWPWLAQMGAGSRGGWYSYDRVDNGGVRSATRIRPELQQLEAGMVLPAHPAATTAFEVITFEPLRFLVLGWRDGGVQRTTWAFRLDQPDPDTTRLLVRARASAADGPTSVRGSIARRMMPFAHAIMEREQLLGIARRAERCDPLLEQFIPEYDVAERHQVRVAAPPDRAFAAAMKQDLMRPALVRAIVRAREVMLGASHPAPPRSHGLVPDLESLGWGVLADERGREVVMGAATRPWEPSPVFRALAPAAFHAFAEPGYVKIAWSVRADPAGNGTSIIRTETRVRATDAPSRRRFRHYWRRVGPGTALIRRAILRAARRDAETKRTEFAR
jgi:hypothetical protein